MKPLLIQAAFGLGNGMVAKTRSELIEGIYYGLRLSPILEVRIRPARRTRQSTEPPPTAVDQTKETH